MIQTRTPASESETGNTNIYTQLIALIALGKVGVGICMRHARARGGGGGREKKGLATATHSKAAYHHDHAHTNEVLVLRTFRYT